MAVDFTMPKLGLTMDEGTVVRWLAAEGDQVAAGQVILEVQTDKVTVEVEAPADGVLGAIVVREGETVPVGALLAQILMPGEAQPERTRVTPLARRIAAQEGIDLANRRNERRPDYRGGRAAAGCDAGEAVLVAARAETGAGGGDRLADDRRQRAARQGDRAGRPGARRGHPSPCFCAGQ